MPLDRPSDAPAGEFVAFIHSHIGQGSGIDRETCSPSAPAPVSLPPAPAGAKAAGQARSTHARSRPGGRGQHAHSAGESSSGSGKVRCMPDQSFAANEHAILQEITAPFTTLRDDPGAITADVDFPVVLRGYDRLAVDAYVKRTIQLVAELHAQRSPEAAIRRATERMGEQISGILQRAYDTAAQITAQSRAEADNRLEVARHEAAQVAAGGERRLRELDGDTDRIWAERLRIVEDARELAGQLIALVESATERFPPAEAEVTAEPEAAEPETGADPRSVSALSATANRGART